MYVTIMYSKHAQENNRIKHDIEKFTFHVGLPAYTKEISQQRIISTQCHTEAVHHQEVFLAGGGGFHPCPQPLKDPGCTWLQSPSLSSALWRRYTRRL